MPSFLHILECLTLLLEVHNLLLQLTPILLEGLSVLSQDVLDKEKLYDLLLVLSGILTDKNGKVKRI